MPSEESEEEKLIMEGSISQQHNPKQNAQSQSQMVKPVASSQYSKKGVTMHGTDVTIEELGRYICSLEL